MEGRSADHIVSGKDDRRTVWTIRRVDCLHLTLHGDSVSQSLSWNADTEHLFVLLSFFSAELHEGTTVRNKSIYDLKIQNYLRFFLTDPEFLVTE